MDLLHLTEEERRLLYEAVLAAARRVAKSGDLAEELTHEAFSRLLTTRDWDPNGPTTLERHMFGIVKSLLWGHRISKRRERERNFAAEHEVLSDASHSAETMSLDRAARESAETRCVQRVRALRAKLAGRELELRICDLMGDDIKKPAKLVNCTGRSAGEVDAALRRVRRYMSSVLAAERGEDAEDGEDGEDAEDGEEVA
ncbi:MAG: hypothetical protein ACREJ3_01295 [Polyangiaceae bacterium]